MESNLSEKRIKVFGYFNKLYLEEDVKEFIEDNEKEITDLEEDVKDLISIEIEKMQIPYEFSEKLNKLFVAHKIEREKRAGKELI